MVSHKAPGADISIVILAAGKGNRMNSSLPKVLHKITGREMLKLVIDTALELNPANLAVVISLEMQEFCSEITKEYPKHNIVFALQEERRGTAHATQIGLRALPKVQDKVLVMYGDTPLLASATLQKMLEKLEAEDSSLCVLGFTCLHPNNYGRLIIKEEQLYKITEFKDAAPEERAITLCNSGVMAFKTMPVLPLMSLIKNNNASGEYYLTDLVNIVRNRQLKCSFIESPEEEVMGINTKNELAKAETLRQNQIRDHFLKQGVTMLDPASVYFSFDTKIAASTLIHQQVVFGQKVQIEEEVEIKPFCLIEGATIKKGAIIGPFARLRPTSVIEEEARIGNFVEIKQSEVKKAAKINHLSYVGDSQIGEEANIGAGTITCNYDGYNKFPTKIGKKVFIGSNSSLIAPLTIGDEAIVGAGSVITKDVNPSDLVVARAKPVTLKAGAKQYRKKKQPPTSK